jgi:hypothetical protein
MRRNPETRAVDDDGYMYSLEVLSVSTRRTCNEMSPLIRSCTVPVQPGNATPYVHLELPIDHYIAELTIDQAERLARQLLSLADTLRALEGAGL